MRIEAHALTYSLSVVLKSYFFTDKNKSKIGSNKAKMESEIPVVSTTSSIDLTKQEARNGGDESTSEKAADSTVQNNDEEPKNGTKGEDDSEVALIEGLAKPSEELEKVDFHRNSHNRVKLYVLCDQRAWDDKGTGHVACLQSPENNNIWCVIVRLESNERNVLESKVQLDTVYQKQQGTLIVWSESDTVDLALSFQEKTGCTELWEKICRIQGRDPDAETEEENEADEQENAQSDSSTTGVPSVTSGGAIPSCTLQNLAELEQVLASSMFANSQREKMANAILQNGYIPKLCELFAISEDLENKEALQHMASIGKNLFLLNNNAILTELIDEKHFQSIVGMLEYDASYTQPKRHRAFLWERSKFKEVLPISSEELKAKIHQTFRLQYVQDVCLPAPSIFEENLLTVLTSHLFFIRADIVNTLLSDKDLMQRLFEELKNPNISADRQKDLTNFLKEFCSFAHSLQPTGPQGREQFFKTMLNNDVLNTIDPCISSPLASTRTATVELLTIIVDFNPQIFREFLVKQFRQIPESKNASLLINKLINHMLSDRDPEFTAAHQMANILKILLDPESIVAVWKGEKGEFLQMFYKRAMHTLCAPITENAKEGKPICDSYYMANKIALIVDLLCFFVEHHSYNMRAYTIQKGLLPSVLVYLKSQHHFLAHSALRLLRRIIGLKDEVYIRHIYDKGILNLVVDCFVANGARYNLLNSSLVELFEYMRTEEIRPLIHFTIQKHWEGVFSKVDYVKTFAQMKIRCDQFPDGPIPQGGQANESKEAPVLPPLAMTPPNAQWRKEREHDDEELFFSSKDEDDEMPAPQLRKSGVEPMFPSLLSRKRKATEEEDSTASVFGGNITPPAGSATSIRMSKIMIRMGTKEPSRQPLQTQQEPETKSSGGASSATPVLQQQKVTALPEEEATTQVPTTTTSSSSPKSPSYSLKRPLVDYADSDEEDGEEDEEGDEAQTVDSSSSGGKRKRDGGKGTDQPKKGAKAQSEPSKMPKFAPDSSTSDPASPPPDPEQQQRTASHPHSSGSNSDISASS